MTGVQTCALPIYTVNSWVCMCLDKLPVKRDTFKYVADGKKFKKRVTKANDKKAFEINLVVEEIPEDDDKNQE